MLLTLKEDNTTGGFHLSCLLHVFSMIIRSGLICTDMHLYTVIIGTDDMAVYMCPCMLFISTCVMC